MILSTVVGCRLKAATTWLAALSILSIVLPSGCSNDESFDGSGGAAGNGGTGGRAATGGAGGDGAPAAFLCTLLVTPDARTGFLRVVRDAELQGGEIIDATAGAREFGGGVSCVSRGNAVFASAWEGATTTRFDLVDGELVEGGTVSFAGLGVTNVSIISESWQIVSDTKAYYVDDRSLQLIVWNPETMQILDSIDIVDTFAGADGERATAFSAGQLAGRLVLWTRYVSPLFVVTSRSTIAFVDVDTDTLVSDTVENCGGLGASFVVASSGDAYFASTPFSAAEHALGLEGSFSPCALRVRAGQSRFDRGFLGDLNALASRPTGGIGDGGEDVGLLVGYDESSNPIDQALTARELTQLAAWEFLDWMLGTTETPTEVAGLGAGTGDVAVIQFDGRSFLVRANFATASSELIDLSVRPPVSRFQHTEIFRYIARAGE